jgi:hypothetical protein
MLVPSKLMPRPVRLPPRARTDRPADPRRSLDPEMRALLRRLDDIPYPARS